MLSTAWEGILKYPFVLLTGFVVSFVLTPLVKRLAMAIGVVDIPGDRHIHQRPVPRCGLPVFFGFHAGCAAVFLLPWTPFSGDLTVIWWRNFLILSTLLVLIGLADDRWQLRPWVKLGGQVLVALLAFAFDMRAGRFLGFELPVVLDVLVTVFWF